MNTSAHAEPPNVREIMSELVSTTKSRSHISRSTVSPYTSIDSTQWYRPPVPFRLDDFLFLKQLQKLVSHGKYFS